MNINIEDFSIMAEDNIGQKHIILDGNNTMGNISNCTLQVFNDSVSIAEMMLSVLERNPFKPNSKDLALASLVENSIIANHLISKNTPVSAYVVNDHNTGLVWNVRETLRIFNENSTYESEYPEMITKNKILSFNIVIIDINVNFDYNILDENLFDAVKECNGLLIINSSNDVAVLNTQLNAQNVEAKKICVSDNFYIYAYDFKNSRTNKDIKLEKDYIDLKNKINTMDKKESLKLINSINDNIANSIADNDVDTKNMLIDSREYLINHLVSL